MPTDPAEKAMQIAKDIAVMDKVRQQMDSEENKKVEERKEDAAKADAFETSSFEGGNEGTKIDKILECLDSLGKRMDSYDKARKDGAEAAMMSDKRKKDAEEKEMEEEGKPKEMKADSRMDSDEIRNELSEIQTRADSVCSARGQDARKPMQNELPHEYRRRVATPLKQYSDSWKNVNLRELSGEALKVATDQIFKDAYAAATSNDTFAGNGFLRESRRTDPTTGHRIREYYGDPMSWMSQFTGNRYKAKFDMTQSSGP